MIINEHGFYIIDDRYFQDFNDSYLRGNHEENRPHYYCFKDSNTGLLWIIPLSSRTEKYKTLIERKTKEGKPCDVFHVMKLAGKESAFLIGDMFPITEKYILREYTIGKHPLKLMDKHQIKDLDKKARKVLALIKKGVKFNPTQPDVMKIAQELIENYKLYVEAEKRMKNANDDDFISSKDVFLNLGITKEDIEDIEVERK